MAADSEFTPVVRRLGCLRGVSTLTAFGLAVEIGDWHRLTGRSIGAYLGLVPTEYSSGDDPVTGRDHQDRQRPRPPAADRGGLASPHPATGPAAICAAAGTPPAAARARGQPPTGACTAAGPLSTRARNARDRQRRDRPRTGRLVLVTGRHDRLSTAHKRPDERRWCRQRLGVTRVSPMSNHVVAATGSRSISRPAANSNSKVPSCGNQPAHIRLTTRRHRHARHHPKLIRPNEAAATTTVPDAASPCPLDKPPPISVLQP